VLAVGEVVTAHELAAALTAGADVPVYVPGHGALHSVTRAASAEGDRVVLLYVVAPVADEAAEFTLIRESAGR